MSSWGLAIDNIVSGSLRVMPPSLVLEDQVTAWELVL